MAPNKDNPEDNQAVEILYPANGNERVGYIQKPYNQISHLLSKEYSFQAIIDFINTQDKRPTIIIEVKEYPWYIQNKNFDYLIVGNN